MHAKASRNFPVLPRCSSKCDHGDQHLRSLSLCWRLSFIQLSSISSPSVIYPKHSLQTIYRNTYRVVMWTNCRQRLLCLFHCIANILNIYINKVVRTSRVKYLGSVLSRFSVLNCVKNKKLCPSLNVVKQLLLKSSAFLFFVSPSIG